MVYFSLLPLLVIVLFFVGLVLAVIGFRGRPVFTTPRCARCQYDLRTLNFLEGTADRCPECGSELGIAGNVSFGRLKGWPKMIIWGLLMMILPWGLLFAAFFAIRPTTVMVAGGSPIPSASTSTATLLAGLPSTIDQPWNWQELERRLKIPGTLSTAEVDQALAALSADVTAKRAKGQPVTWLPWSGSFVANVLKVSAGSPEAREAFLQVYFAESPTVAFRDRVRVNTPLLVRLSRRHDANLNDVTQCWALRSVQVDGKTMLRPEDRYNSNTPTASHPDRFSSQQASNIDLKLPQTLAPGEHELLFTFDLGIVSNPVTFRGLDGRPGTFDKWPNPLSHWQATVKHKLTVVPEGKPVVDLETDAALDPSKSGTTLAIGEALVRPASNGVQLAISWTRGEKIPNPAYSYRVEVAAGKITIPYGRFHWSPYDGNGSYQHITDRCDTAPLPPEVKHVDIRLTPDPTIAEDNVELQRIWGKPIEFLNVPLQRYDLPKEPAGK